MIAPFAKCLNISHFYVHCTKEILLEKQPGIGTCLRDDGHSIEWLYAANIYLICLLTYVSEDEFVHPF